MPKKSEQGWLRTLYEVLHDVQTMTSHFHYFYGKIVFVSDEICAIMPQKSNYELKKI